MDYVQSAMKWLGSEEGRKVLDLVLSMVLLLLGKKGGETALRYQALVRAAQDALRGKSAQQVALGNHVTLDRAEQILSAVGMTPQAAVKPVVKPSVVKSAPAGVVAPVEPPLAGNSRKVAQRVARELLWSSLPGLLKR